MAYIHVKKIGDRKYYSLRVSVRKGNRVVTKDLCNLGSDLSRINLRDLEREYKKEVRKSYKTLKKFLDSNRFLEKAKKSKIKASPFFTKDLLLEIEAIRLHYKSKFIKLDKSTRNEVFESFLIKFAVNSTSIEGNTITLKEAYRLFTDDIMPKDRSLREVYDLTNTKKTVKFLYETKPKLNSDLIVKIHDMLLDKIDKRKGFRTTDIHIFGQPFKPAPAKYVKSDISLLIKWYNKNKGKMHPLALSIFFHHKFESIHPFSDGNGRTGRVIMNYILSENSYPPLVISNRFRKIYIKSMNKADDSVKKDLLGTNTEKYRGLIEFVVSEYKLSYWDTFLV